jgi:hypothetical protein
MHDHRTYFQEIIPDTAFSEVFCEFVESFPKEYREKSTAFYNNAIHAATRVRHYFFSLKITLDRYNTSSRQLRAVQIPFSKSLQDDLTLAEERDEQQIRLDRIKDRLRPVFMLDYESFFLIAKILLDRVANFVEFIFGLTPKLSLDSHNHFVKNISEYSIEKGLEIPESMKTALERMQESISDFSEYDIGQQKSPKAVLSTGFDSEGIARVAINFINPAEGDSQKQGIDPNDLFEEIDRYVYAIFKMVVEHKHQYVLSEELSPTGV